MSFFKRLRQEKEEEAQRIQMLLHQRNADDQARRQREEDRKQYHKQQKEAAEKFRKESGLSNVISELETILGDKLFNDKGPYTRDKRASTPVIDNSVIDIIVWNKGREIRTHTVNRGFSGTYYGEYSANYIEIETCPDGTIIIKSGGWKSTYKILKPDWESNPNIIEEILEKAYRKPKTSTFTAYKSDFNNSPGFG
jgi:hypothetical protein